MSRTGTLGREMNEIHYQPNIQENLKSKSIKIFRISPHYNVFVLLYYNCCYIQSRKMSSIGYVL